MPAPRTLPARSSQRRNSVQDDTATRTRSTRGAPAAARPETTEVLAPKQSPHKLSPTITRKTTRSASNISSQPSFTDAAPEVYASYERPFLMVFGLSREFFDGLKKHHGKLPKQRKNLEDAVQESDSSNEDSVSESEESTNESDESADVTPTTSHAAPRGRGRGGRGSRGGRGRGGRGRGRGGRGRGGLVRTISPTRSRPSRSAAPIFPLMEEDDGLSNQTTPNGEGLASPPPNEDEQMTDASEAADDLGLEVDVDSDLEEESIGNAHLESMTPAGSPPSTTTPQGSPPKGLLNAIIDGTYTPSLIAEPAPKVPKLATKARVPKISLTTNSASHTPQESASTPAEALKPLDPEDDILSEEDLPGPWNDDFYPQPLDDCEDMADYLLQRRYKAMSDVNKIIAALNKFPVAQRSTENLYALAENAQYILKCWQDEYLELDARVSCIRAHPDVELTCTRLHRTCIRQRKLAIVGGFLWPLNFSKTLKKRIFMATPLTPRSPLAVRILGRSVLVWRKAVDESFEHVVRATCWIRRLQVRRTRKTTKVAHLGGNGSLPANSTALISLQESLPQRNTMGGVVPAKRASADLPCLRLKLQSLTAGQSSEPGQRLLPHCISVLCMKVCARAR